MEMKRINAGKLRAVGYSAPERKLRVELDDGSALEYANVGQDIWRRLSTTGSAWSYYRDNIEEEFTCHRAVAARPVQEKVNPLDALFGPAGGDAED
jgi:KTSC domain